MSKAVVYRGADPTESEHGFPVGEWDGDEEVAHVTVSDGVTEIRVMAFHGCTGLANLSFLEDSAITTVGEQAFKQAGIMTLQGVEGVRKIGNDAFFMARTCAPSRAWAARRWASALHLAAVGEGVACLNDGDPRALLSTAPA
jgi:hypothetical protein